MAVPALSFTRGIVQLRDAGFDCLKYVDVALSGRQAAPSWKRAKVELFRTWSLSKVRTWWRRAAPKLT